MRPGNFYFQKEYVILKPIPHPLPLRLREGVTSIIIFLHGTGLLKKSSLLPPAPQGIAVNLRIVLEIRRLDKVSPPFEANLSSHFS